MKRLIAAIIGRIQAEGRPATRDEVVASIDSGLPILRADAEAEGSDAVADLEQMHSEALALIPREEVTSNG